MHAVACSLSLESCSVLSTGGGSFPPPPQKKINYPLLILLYMSINTPGHDVAITHTHASGLTIKRECFIFQLHVGV